MSENCPPNCIHCSIENISKEDDRELHQQKVEDEENFIDESDDEIARSVAESEKL